MPGLDNGIYWNSHVLSVHGNWTSLVMAENCKGWVSGSWTCNVLGYMGIGAWAYSVA